MTPRLKVAAALDQCGISYPADADEDALLAIFVAAFDIVARALSSGFIRAAPGHQVMPSRARLPDPTKAPEVVA